MTGRPSDYTTELAAAICAELATGRSLRSVCDDDGMPDRSTVFRWLASNDAFRDQYARAKAESADALVEDMLDIADDSVGDFIETDKGPAFNAEHVQRSKLRVDTRKWIAAKLKPKKYGDKVEVDNKHSGNVGMTILTAVPEAAPVEPEPEA